MYGDMWEASNGFGACRLFRIPTCMIDAKILSTSIRFVSLRGSCGAIRRRPAIPCIWTYGRTTLSQSDLSALPALPRDEGGPVFAEPWEAQAFAMAVRLSAAGYFTWKEFAA